MARTRVAGCLVLAGAIAGPASAEFACPGSVQPSPAAPPGIVAMQSLDRATDTPADLHRYRVFESADYGAGPCFEDFEFRLADPEEAIARRLPAPAEAGLAAGLMNITFGPGPAGHDATTLVARSMPGDGLLPTGDLELAGMPGLPVVRSGLVSVPAPAEGKEPGLDVPTLVASIAGIGMAISLISAAMMKVPR